MITEALIVTNGVALLGFLAVAFTLYRGQRDRASEKDAFADSMLQSREAEEATRAQLTATAAAHKNELAEKDAEHRKSMAVIDAFYERAANRRVAEHAEECGVLRGQLFEVHRKADKLDAIMRGHVFHLGGKAEVHERGVELIRECSCGYLRFTEAATEGSATDGS